MWIPSIKFNSISRVQTFLLPWWSAPSPPPHLTQSKLFHSLNQIRERLVMILCSQLDQFKPLEKSLWSFLKGERAKGDGQRAERCHCCFILPRKGKIKRKQEGQKKTLDNQVTHNTHSLRTSTCQAACYACSSHTWPPAILTTVCWVQLHGRHYAWSCDISYSISFNPENNSVL